MSTAVMTERIAGQTYWQRKMRSAKSVGRIVGVLLLAHFAAFLMGFVLLERVKGPEGLLTNAAGSPVQVRTAVFLLFAGSAGAVGIAITALRVFRQHSETVALWLLALAVTAFSLQAVDNAHILTMLSLSQVYAKAGAAQPELLQALAVVAGSARKWAHYAYLFVYGGWIFLLYSLLYRFQLVPRLLAAFGVIASMLQITGVTLRGLLGYPPETRLAMPLAPAYVALALWLMIKGFDEQHRDIGAEA